MKRSAVAALVSLALASCQYDPHAHAYTKAVPDAKHLVGTWNLTPESRVWLKKRFGAEVGKHRLDLNSDGSFIIEGIPDCWRIAEDGKAKTARETGTWTVAPHQEWQALQMVFSSSPTFTATFMLKYTSAPYRIHIIVGDPDSGEGIDLDRN